MTPQNKKPVAATILCISMFQMGMVALAPVIASISTAFPNASQLSAQLAATFLNLVLVIVALFSGAISRAIGRRSMCVAGLGLFVLAAVCGTFLSRSLFAVYLWSAFLGAGTGLFVPCVSSMLLDYFSDEERPRIAGLQTSAVNLGGVALSLLAGILASGRWSRAYLSFLLALPVLCMCLRWLPKEGRAGGDDRPAPRARIPAIVWSYAAQTTLFAIIYFAFSTNVSLLLEERSLASSSLSGLATAAFMLGGCAFGFLFNPVMKRLKKRTAIGAFVLLAASYLVIYFFDGLFPLLLGAFVGGGSLSLIFPFFLVRLGGRVDPSVTVLSTSLILSVGPNLGSFLSPVVLTGLAGLTGADSVAFRFLAAALLALLLAAVLLLLSLRRGDD